MNALVVPDLFARDAADRRFVSDQVAADCEWVLAGEGKATRQYNGICVLYDPLLGVEPFGVPLALMPQLQGWWVRRTVKVGQDFPTDYVVADVDAAAGRVAGWEPVEQSPATAAFLAQALVVTAGRGDGPGVGTHELIGPKINRNPERVRTHVLIAHVDADVLPAPRTYDGLRAWLPTQPYEGVVFQHSDGRMAKAKRRDFRA